jgi:hypothetical protein
MPAGREDTVLCWLGPVLLVDADVAAEPLTVTGRLAVGKIVEACRLWVKARPRQKYARLSFAGAYPVAAKSSG